MRSTNLEWFMLKKLVLTHNDVLKNVKVLRPQHRFCSIGLDDEKEKEIQKIQSNASIEEPPTTCCGSGCANCVFVIWAEALAKKMDNAGPEIAEKILKMVDDPSMKAYLEMELRLRGLKK
ncbi:unnamed protein product [Leptidea sinapis]|uniref:Oxidoreductase-like domain-containing protein n=1 Tax=Leptidea sinapis TaxID=189913 RepID=A0A5E4QND6_9NEOP|nr:unnamed protein product [Leptidea sinapis]